MNQSDQINRQSLIFSSTTAKNIFSANAFGLIFLSVGFNRIGMKTFLGKFQTRYVFEARQLKSETEKFARI